MLGKKDVTAMVAVKNLDIAKNFYEGKLGIKIVPTDQKEVQVGLSGNTKFLLYVSEFAGTNKATSLCWAVGKDIEEIVQSLKTKGISFEHYDFPHSTLEGDIHIFKNMKTAWFKDPDGNIINLVNQ